MRAPFGQKAVAAPLATGCGAGWAATWAEADFAAKAAALARPSAVRTSRREPMVYSLSFARLVRCRSARAALPQCRVFTAAGLRSYRKGALMRKWPRSPVCESHRSLGPATARGTCGAAPGDGDRGGAASSGRHL